MKNKYQYWTSFDLPIPYKGDLFFYPVTMRNYPQWIFYSECLAIDKDSVPDISVISMTYLEYIYSSYFIKKEIQKEGLTFLDLLDGILKLCLKLDGDDSVLYGYDEKKKPFININGTIYNSADFDVMMEIICEQNSLTLPDYSVQKEIRDRMEEERVLKEKLNKTKVGSLEDQIICVLSSTKFSLDEIENLSVRKFFKIIQRVDHKIHYEIYLTASMSGFVKFKSPPVHWMASLDKEDQYEDYKISVEDYKGKFG